MQIFTFSLVMSLLGLAMLVFSYRLFLVMLPIWEVFLGLWLGADTSILEANTVLLSLLLLFRCISLQELESTGSAILLAVQEYWLWLVIILIITGVGIWSQMRANRKYKFKREYYVEGWRQLSNEVARQTYCRLPA